MGLLTDIRKYPREEVFRPVTFLPNGQEAMALDLSLGGARVGLLDAWRPTPDAVMPLSFLSDTDHAITLRCRVTRVEVDHIGVAFEPEQDEDVRRLFREALH